MNATPRTDTAEETARVPEGWRATTDFFRFEMTSNAEREAIPNETLFACALSCNDRGVRIELLAELRGDASVEALVANDLREPANISARTLGLPCGLVHPGIVSELARVLGIREVDVQDVLAGASGVDESGHVWPLEPGSYSDRIWGPRGIARAIEVAGIAADDFLLSTLRVPPGQDRPNVRPFDDGHAVLSPQNAAWLSVLDEATAVRHLRSEGQPLLAAVGECQLQKRFERLVEALGGLELTFRPLSEFPSDPPRPQVELLEPPAFAKAYVRQELTAPLDACFIEEGVLLRFANALAQVNLASGHLHVRPLGRGDLRAVSEDGARVLVCHPSGNFRACAYDVRTRSFSNARRGLPHRVIAGVCCDIELVDLETKTGAEIPGPGMSSSLEFSTSPCGRWGWLHLHPRDDDIGVFDIASGRRSFQLWPHELIAEIHGDTKHDFDSEASYDLTARALVRHGRSFRLFYGGALLDGSKVTYRFDDVTLARFCRTGDRLLLVRAGDVVIVDLGVDGIPVAEYPIALDAIAEHVTCRSLLLPHGLDEQDLMMAVGTLGALAEIDAPALQRRFEQLFSEIPALEVAEEILRRARRVELPRRLSIVPSASVQHVR